MLNCLICGGPTKEEWKDFCEDCLHSPISELEKRYQKRASDTVEDDQEAHEQVTPNGETAR
jgi:hypothetical protein